jgi:hypothetical protein
MIPVAYISKVIGGFTGLYLMLQEEALIKVVSPITLTPYPSWICPKTW